MRAPAPPKQSAPPAISPRNRARMTMAMGTLGITLMLVSAVLRDLVVMMVALVMSAFIALYFIFYTRSRARMAGILMLSAAVISLGLIFAVIATALTSIIVPGAIDSVNNIAIVLQAIIAYCELVLGW